MNNNNNHVAIEPMYETEEGLEFIPNPDDHEFIKKQCEEGIFKMAFRLHSVDCAEIYAVFNNDKWTNHYDLYRYTCLKRNSKEELHKLLTEGEFDIGIARLGSYHVIKEITPYSHDDNDEIRMHYELPRTIEGNIAWRSINYGSDVFHEIVENLNK
jgi:hypothetical protein